MAHPPYTVRTALRAIAQRGGVPNIGQIDKTVAKGLDRLVRKGVLIKYRGFWNTLSPTYGMGPLKTIWARPEMAEVI